MGIFTNNRMPMQGPPRPINQQKGEGCKIKVRRDSNGRVVGYEDNGKCEKSQIKAFTENINFDGGEESDDE